MKSEASDFPNKCRASAMKVLGDLVSDDEEGVPGLPFNFEDAKCKKVASPSGAVHSGPCLL